MSKHDKNQCVGFRLGSCARNPELPPNYFSVQNGFIFFCSKVKLPLTTVVYQLIDRFRPDEKAYFNFKVNEPIYRPEIKIGGHDNVTIINSDNLLHRTLR